MNKEDDLKKNQVVSMLKNLRKELVEIKEKIEKQFVENKSE
jgi:hypothetical protein